MIDSGEARLAAAITQNNRDMVQAFKLDHFGWLNDIARRLFDLPARHITHLVFEFDRRVGEQGLAAASGWLLEQFTASVQISGALPITSGPLLIVSNHPGLVDAMMIFAQLGQRPVRVLAAERPILRLLSHTIDYLIFIPDESDQRLAAIRAAAAHLHQGGVLVTFPGGHIEPDPALHPDAAESVRHWSDSIALFTRLAPDLQVLPVAVHGVISPRALRHPITRLYRTVERREWVAATLQVMLPRFRDTHVTLRIGAPIIPTDALMVDVRAQMATLLAC